MCCCLLGPLLCIISFCWYVFGLLVVWVKFQYLRSDWPERLVWGSLTMAKGSSPKSQAEECVWFSWFILLFHCSIVWLCCSPALRDIHCSSMAWYSLSVLKVTLINNRPNHLGFCIGHLHWWVQFEVENVCCGCKTRLWGCVILLTQLRRVSRVGTVQEVGQWKRVISGICWWSDAVGWATERASSL